VESRQSCASLRHASKSTVTRESGKACAIRVHEGALTAPGKKFAIVVGQFNSLVTDRLKDGALAGLRKAGVLEEDIEMVNVPGSFEIPVVAKAMALSNKFDAIICIGAVVRGATTHYEEVCSAATSGCLNAAAATGVPSKETTSLSTYL
jgi:6,7-dimethyl-8-ribityllumazine synthase